MFKKYSYLIALSALAILSVGQDLRAMCGAGAGAGVDSDDAARRIKNFNDRAVISYGTGSDLSLPDGTTLVSVRFAHAGVAVKSFLDLRVGDLIAVVKDRLGKLTPSKTTLVGDYTLSSSKTKLVDPNLTLRDFIGGLSMYEKFDLVATSELKDTPEMEDSSVNDLAFEETIMFTKEVKKPGPVFIDLVEQRRQKEIEAARKAARIASLSAATGFELSLRNRGVEAVRLEE